MRGRVNFQERQEAGGRRKETRQQGRMKGGKGILTRRRGEEAFDHFVNGLILGTSPH